MENLVPKLSVVFLLKDIRVVNTNSAGIFIENSGS